MPSSHLTAPLAERGVAPGAPLNPATSRSASGAAKCCGSVVAQTHRDASCGIAHGCFCVPHGYDAGLSADCRGVVRHQLMRSVMAENQGDSAVAEQPQEEQFTYPVK